MLVEKHRVKSLAPALKVGVVVKFLYAPCLLARWFKSVDVSISCVIKLHAYVENWRGG